MRTFIFGTPDSSYKTRVIEAASLEDAITTYSVAELNPELHVRREDVIKTIREARYPYPPVLEVSPDAVIEIYEARSDDFPAKVAEVKVFDILSMPLEEQAHLLESPPSEKTVSILQPGGSLQTKSKYRSRFNELIRLKQEAELEIKKINAEIEAIEKDLENKAKTLRLMKNYAGIDTEIVQIKDGFPASENEPLTIYQAKRFMDEEVGILGLMNGGTDSIDVRNLEEFDKWIAENFEAFMPAKKALTVWQVRRNTKRYALGCDAESELFNSVMNQGNFQTYFLIRNGERLWRFTSDFHVPDEVFPKLNVKRDWSSEREMKKDTEKRLFALAALQGIIDRTDILGTRLRDKGINLLQPAPCYDKRDIVFIRDAEPGQLITDGHPRWRDYLKANQEGITKGSRIMQAVSDFELRQDCESVTGWQVTRSTSTYTRVYSTPDAGTIYTVEDVDDSYWGADGLKILFNPKDEVYRYQGDWVSGHQRMKRIGFRYFRDEVIDVDAISFADISYYLTSRLDRPDYATMLPLLARLWKWKRKENEEEKPFVMLLASKAGLGWPDAEKRIRDVIHWWKTKNRIHRAITKDDALAFRMCLKKLKEEKE